MSEPSRLNSDDFDRARELGHETSDVRFSSVAWFGLALAVLIASSMWLIYWLAGVLSGPSESTVDLEPRENAPLMFRDDVRANQHLLRLRQEELRQEVLGSYAWIDREEDIARIPIRVAMQILGERGNLPTWVPERTEEKTDAVKPEGE